MKTPVQVYLLIDFVYLKLIKKFFGSKEAQKVASATFIGEIQLENLKMGDIVPLYVFNRDYTIDFIVGRVIKRPCLSLEHPGSKINLYYRSRRIVPSDQSLDDAVEGGMKQLAGPTADILQTTYGFSMSDITINKEPQYSKRVPESFGTIDKIMSGLDY